MRLGSASYYFFSWTVELGSYFLAYFSYYFSQTRVSLGCFEMGFLTLASAGMSKMAYLSMIFFYTNSINTSISATLASSLLT